MRSVRSLTLAALSTALLAGCGGHARKLGDGQWYGKIESVDVAHRRLDFAPACHRNESGSWGSAPDGARVTIALAGHPNLEIYVRPGGDASAGHEQSADLRRIADVVAHGHLPSFPPGWFVAVRGGTPVSVAEDSGVRSSGKPDERTFACVWSRKTQAFVSP
jgi:hypothetical protein